MVLEITSDNFDKEVSSSDLPVIIDFFAEWCSPCQMMKPVFESLNKDYSKKLKFAKVDTETSPEIAEKYEISGIPCLIILNKGEEVDRIVGYKTESELKKSIDLVLNKI